MSLMSSHFRGDQRILLAQQNAPPLRKGLAEHAVRLLQQALIDLGYPMPISTEKYKTPDGVGTPDGDYGGETRSKVWQFQKDNDLGKDGVAGKNTITKIDELLFAKRIPMKPLPDLPPDAPGGFQDAAENARLFMLNTLASSPLRNGYYTIKDGSHSVTIAGFHYDRVAKRLHDRVITVREEPHLGSAASYIPTFKAHMPGVSGPVDANTFLVKAALRRTHSHRSLVIHEATHAVCDLLGKTMNALFSEKVAFIMEAIFFRKRLGGPKPGGEKAYAIADQIAQHILSGKTGSDADRQAISNLMRDLGVNLQKYGDYKDYQYGTVQYDGI